MDDVYEGRSGSDSVRPVFGSYAGMLARVTACRAADGTVVSASVTNSGEPCA